MVEKGGTLPNDNGLLLLWGADGGCNLLLGVVSDHLVVENHNYAKCLRMIIQYRWSRDDN
jgi:hypothetical protein